MQLNEIGTNIQYVDNDYNPYDISTEDFLKIYLKMLELQDPTEPLKIEDMINQNYQLQQISFLTRLEETMQSLAAAQRLNYVTQAGFLIGKNVVFQTDEITDTSLQYVLLSPENYGTVDVTITDKNTGKVVKTEQIDLVKGLNNLNVADLPAGDYTVAVYKDGNQLNDVILGISGTVEYISLINNEPMLGLPFGEKPLKDVVYIST
ncbi:MAG TPA: hypothetical protein EYO62_06205 [Aquificales bacterium]|nr:hypothetical protein [Aquificales bacterium]